MSHHIHVFLSNEGNAEDCMSWINAQFDDTMLASNWVDGAEVLGCINLATGQYVQNRYAAKDDRIDSIEKLEKYANAQYSKELYKGYVEEIQAAIKEENWWRVSRIARYLDGMKYAVKDGLKWTAKQPFCINDGYLDMPGVTDWTGAYQELDENCNPTEYAVIVDFHS